MNPFTIPDKVVVYRYPQDMRAGIQRLSEIVACEMGLDAMDGSLYVFVSRDCRKVKLLRFETTGWCCWYVRLVEGAFKWRHDGEEGAITLEIERRQLLWLLEGLPVNQPQAPEPVTAHGIL